MLIHLKQIQTDTATAEKYFLNNKEIRKKSYFKILHYINKRTF